MGALAVLLFAAFLLIGTGFSLMGASTGVAMVLSLILVIGIVVVWLASDPKK